MGAVARGTARGAPRWTDLPGPAGAQAGDLYVTVSVARDPQFRRKGRDIITEQEISLTDAILGTAIEVPTLEGHRTIKIRPGTQSHTKIRLKGCGVPDIHRAGKGDLFVNIIVKIPKSLTKEQKELFEKLKEEGI